MVIFEKKCGCRVFSFKVGPYLVADFTDFCFVYWDRKLKVSSCRLLLLVIYQSSQSVLHAQWTNERAAVPSIAISLDGRASFSVIERTDYVFLRNGIFFFLFFYFFYERNLWICLVEYWRRPSWLISVTFSTWPK